ncbi:hypothetical protein [Piscirickettsia litoralis]|uniref:Uncharacterized protein n=1 Tax=Piscirickettsia litoralis TaxID=1891921 RepID=A0ABX3A4E1_9GAMM|nr:hypothetical protein [Piscirickettsia litoralis]ODN43727.1 hypothetical protein BGC07_13505 [Piscirickettsia litoralis]
MNNGKPHIREILSSLHQITGTPWREVHDQTTICLAFNTDLTDHAVHPTEKSMWPVRTRFVAPIAHDKKGCHESWRSSVKHFFAEAFENVGRARLQENQARMEFGKQFTSSITSGLHEVNGFVDRHQAGVLIAAGIILVAATPFGWALIGVSEAIEGTAILADAVVSIRSAEIGETLGSQSRNIFYGLKEYVIGNSRIAAVGAGPTSIVVGNWEKKPR